MQIEARKHVKRNSKPEKSFKHKLKLSFVCLIFILTVFSMGYFNYTIKGQVSFFLGVYGSFMLFYLLLKMGLSFFYKPYTGEPPDLKVTVIIPSYNESAKAVTETVKSILEQDYPIHEIFFVDDGSKDLSGYRTIKEMEQTISEIAVTGFGYIPKLIAHRLERNSGKRHAQIYAFERATGDVFLTIDSDGYLYPNAVRELLKPLNDPQVMAVTGHINARNKNDNILTKLLDMRYDNAFRVERAAQSVTGNILVCSGPISVYRKEVILDNIEHYGNQTFLGEAVQFGDDRCLTNYAIKKGRTVYQSTAKCITDVPRTMRQFIKQQIRWNKSFFRETLIAFKLGFKKPKTLLWVASEASLWILFSIALMIAILFKIKVYGWMMLIYYLAYISLSAYARNVFFILKRPYVFLLAPVYGIIHLLVLFPLRIYALLTIKSTGWGTR
jgi:hyaluronan synthase